MAKRTALVCRNCGVPRGEDKWTHRTYCPDCWRTYQRNRWNGLPGFPGRTHVWTDELPEKNCQHCGQSFRPKIDSPSRPAVFCSRWCKDRAKKDRLIAERLAAKPTDRRCTLCGATLPQSMRTDALFCSAACNDRAHQLPRALRVVGNDDSKAMGRLRSIIFERDHWLCGICREAVDPILCYPDPMCATIDHIVPVVEGGTHDPFNLRLAHLRCNAIRKNRGEPEQLSMF